MPAGASQLDERRQERTVQAARTSTPQRGRDRKPANHCARGIAIDARRQLGRRGALPLQVHRAGAQAAVREAALVQVREARRDVRKHGDNARHVGAAAGAAERAARNGRRKAIADAALLHDLKFPKRQRGSDPPAHAPAAYPSRQGGSWADLPTPDAKCVDQGRCTLPRGRGTRRRRISQLASAE